MKQQTAAERFASAITSLLIRIHDYCKTAAESPICIGLCIANQKHAPHRQIPEEICKELMQKARDHFMSINVPEFYFHLWPPPKLPIVEGVNTNIDKKNQIKSGKESWKTHYKGIQDLFKSDKTLFDFYKIAKEKVLNSRNDAYRLLLTNFVEYIENSLIKKTDLSAELKLVLLNNLRGIGQKKMNHIINIFD